jgi:DNA polymerase III delta subunit
MKLKAVDFLQKKREDLAVQPIILIDGDDVLLREILADYYIEATGLPPESIEKKEIQDARNLAGEWLEGSLMGPRLLKIYTPGKMKNPEFLLQVVKNKNTEDRLILIATETWTGATQLKVIENILYVEANEPKNVKEKQKYVATRLPFHNLILDEDSLNAVAERSDKVVDIEMTLTTLRLLSYTVPRISLKEVVAITGEPSKYRDTTRSLIRGNIPRLTKEILDGDPLFTLVTVSHVLLRLHSWLVTPEDNESEEKAAALLRIQKRHLKEWKQARKKFSPQLIRQTLNAVNSVYQDFRMGSKSDWKEKLRLILSKLNQK